MGLKAANRCDIFSNVFLLFVPGSATPQGRRKNPAGERAQAVLCAVGMPGIPGRTGACRRGPDRPENARLLIKMGVNEQTAAEDACKIEHVISDETFDAIKHYLNV